MKKQMVQAVGWYGVGAILVAYGLSNFRVIPPAGILYQALNLTGALAIVVEAKSKKDKQPMILNLVWAAIALAMLACSIAA